MLILFLKSDNASEQDDSDKELLPDKMRRILESHVKAAKTDEERERAERELAKFSDSSSKPQ
jgi:hypothetical protein